jgi:hypothetical protein
VDGDIVTVKSSKGTTADLQTAVDSAMDGNQMKTLTLSGIFQETNPSIAVRTKGPAWDGQLNVWAINAAGIDLGSVVVSGDLAKLTVGGRSHANGAVKSVEVQTIGVAEGATNKSWEMLGGRKPYGGGGGIPGRSSPSAMSKSVGHSSEVMEVTPPWRAVCDSLPSSSPSRNAI